MSDDNPFERIDTGEADADEHHFGQTRDGKQHVCRTEKRGQARAGGRSLFEIVVDASGGFVPLWASGMLMRYRFNARSLRQFSRPEAARTAIRQLFGEAVLAWGDAAPIRFGERRSGIDFEIVVRNSDDCDSAGCVLASAFFPDAGKHNLLIYPKMFSQPREEQIETLVHEIGHIYGLRHFFAPVSESEWASQIFGTHSKFSIMNYGGDSKLTDADRADLKDLYEKVWSGQLREINGTPVKLVKPFSATL